MQSTVLTCFTWLLHWMYIKFQIRIHKARKPDTIFFSVLHSYEEGSGRGVIRRNRSMKNGRRNVKPQETSPRETIPTPQRILPFSVYLCGILYEKPQDKNTLHVLERIFCLFWIVPSNLALTYLVLTIFFPNFQASNISHWRWSCSADAIDQIMFYCFSDK